MSAIAARKARLAAEAQAQVQIQAPEAKSQSTSTASSVAPAKPARRQRQAPIDESVSLRKKARLGTHDVLTESSIANDLEASHEREGEDAPGSDDGSADEGEDAHSSVSSSGSASDEDDGDDLAGTLSSSRASSARPESSGVASSSLRRPPRRKWWKASKQNDSTPQNVTISGSSTGSQVVTMGLQQDEWMSFYGIISLSVLQGCVEVNHCRLDPRTPPQQMFCPHTDPLPAIRAVSSESNARAAVTETSGLDPSHFAAIVRFTTLTDTGLEHLPLACPLAGPDPFGTSPTAATAMRRWGSNSDAASQVHLAFFHTSTDESRLFDAPSSWTDALASATDVKSSTSFLVRGPKGVGKSTLSRTLLNILKQTSPRSRVAFLDLDLGQAELNTPGTVSLHVFDSLDEHSAVPLLSPSWLTHSASSSHRSYSHYLGQVTPKDIPSVYLSAIESLLAKLHSEAGGDKGDSAARRRRQGKASDADVAAHLVVNTMGWTKGLGSELSSRIEALIRPDVILDLQARTTDYQSTSSYQPALLPEPTTTPPYQDAYGGVIHPGSKIIPLHGYTPSDGTVTPASQLLPAADRRTLSIMTALHSTTPSAWQFRTPLIEQKPFIVDVKVADIKMAYVPSIAGNGVTDEEVERRVMALNGELVALCGSQAGESPNGAAGLTANDADPLSAWKARFFSPTSQHAHLNAFHSLAIIRSIDMAASTISLLLPRSASAGLASIQSPTLVASNPSITQTLSLPIWAYLDAQSIKRAMRGWPAVSTANSAQYQDAIAGVPFDQVPFLDFPETTSDDHQGDVCLGADSYGAIVGGQRRRVRRNLMRKNQM